MLELEQLRTGDFADSGARSFVVRASSYAVAAYTLNDKVQLGMTVYLQPRLTALSDLRSLVEAQALIGLIEHLALRLSATLLYDSLPPEGLRAYDSEVKTSLQLAF